MDDRVDDAAPSVARCKRKLSLASAACLSHHDEQDTGAGWGRGVYALVYERKCNRERGKSATLSEGQVKECTGG